jgi:hypothetical protein
VCARETVGFPRRDWFAARAWNRGVVLVRVRLYGTCPAWSDAGRQLRRPRDAEVWLSAALGFVTGVGADSGGALTGLGTRMMADYDRLMARLAADDPMATA